MTPRETLAAIESLDKFGIILGLERIAACMKALGNPQLDFPSIHVAGTNGKGSTSAMISSVLSEAGYKTGLYTSPQLMEFGERMRIDGALINEEKLPGLYKDVLAASHRTPTGAGMTQFELVTAMALLYFAGEGVDFAVIEVGMGGRLDSTNVLKPLVTVITNVGMDHTEHLGTRIDLIAREKAGIAKPGVALVTGAEGEALAAVEEICSEISAPASVLNRDFRVEKQPDGAFTYRGADFTLSGLVPGLLGTHQADNMALALRVVEVLQGAGREISDKAILEGVSGVRWPGRLELLESGEACDRGARVLLDGAHNPHAAKRLRQSLDEGFGRNRLILLLGVLDDKDATAIVAQLAPVADEVVFTRSTSKRALEPGELAEIAENFKSTPFVAETLPEGMDKALEMAGPDDIVLITGSLTIVGEARRTLLDRGWRGLGCGGGQGCGE